MILITGATGFIGSALASVLNRRGRSDLILCDSFGEKDKWKNILGVNFVRFVDRNELFLFLETDALAKKITSVVHLGACADTTETDVDYLVENNVDFSRTLCEWSMKQGVRFVYASSAAVYGDGSLGFSDCDDLTPKLRPLNGYGFSKWMFDMWVLQNQLIGKVAGLRFFNVFGPNEYHKGTMASVIFRAFPLATFEGRVRLFESHRDNYAHGEQVRDFIYVDQVIDAVTYVMDNNTANGIFNVGTGVAHTFNQLAESMLEALDKKINIEYFPMPEEIRDRYQYHTQADMTRLYGAGFPEYEDKFQEYVKKYVSCYLMSGQKYMSQVQ